jgi:hypothetical protein
MLLKSTYEILSSHLDGKPLATDVQVRVWLPDYENLFYVDDERNLFDFPHCRRVLLGSNLLTDDLAMIARQMDLLDVVEELVVKIDYCSPLTPINRLFLKRILQAIGQLQRSHPEATYIIAVERSDFNRTKALYEQMQRSS